MLITRSMGDLNIAADNYRLTFPADRPFVYLDDARGNRIADLFALSSVHPLNGRDDTTHSAPWHIVTESANEIVIELHVVSSVWQSKTYRLRCASTRLTYEIEITGNGTLAEVDYFGGYYSGQRRWGSGFFWSGQAFTRGFNPEPNTEEQNYFSPMGGSIIDVTGVPLPGKGSWFFTPPPFCFAFEIPTGWLALGVEAAPGANRFTEYSYRAQLGFHLALAYDGQTQVHGTYRLPAIGFDFAPNELAALGAHIDSLRRQNFAPMLARPKPAWWHEPIFCGWGAQCYLAAVQGGMAGDYCREENYETFLDTLAVHAINPGIIVIDDKWSMTYGENCVDQSKWKNLRQFIARQHRQQRHVLLWLRAWSAEGLPGGECITNGAGMPVACDPTNPHYQARLRAMIERMLCEYEADGFKIDFTARVPVGYGMKMFGDTWGIELMRLYLGIIYEQAKKLKPDALIMTHTPHPYLADVVDMIRLNDINQFKDINAAMRLRAQVARLACPDAVIDTDNWPQTNRASWRAYTAIQAELGVPSLYVVTHIDSTQEPLDASDYALIRETWARYRGKNYNLTRDD
jgi:hypothetical protein